MYYFILCYGAQAQIPFMIKLEQNFNNCPKKMAKRANKTDQNHHPMNTIYNRIMLHLNYYINLNETFYNKYDFNLNE